METLTAPFHDWQINPWWRRSSPMKIFSAHVEDLTALYIDHLKKALDMEKQITSSLPKLIEHTEDSELAEAFRTHLEETRGHAGSVADILRKHVGDAPAKSCKAMVGLATEASDVIGDVSNPTLREMALIAATQQVEHHEIAVYGTLRQWAELLEFHGDAGTLERIEAEEKHADALLTDIAGRINREAASEKEEGEEHMSRVEEKRSPA
jgi:ferritin-like metal-binding protein YciE